MSQNQKQNLTMDARSIPEEDTKCAALPSSRNTPKDN